MKTYYTGKYAASYNLRWKDFSIRTLANTCSAIDFVRLQAIDTSRGYPVRILDVGCGTGLLLQSLVSRLPQAELYGVDESRDMLDQARLLLQEHPHIHLLQASITGGIAAGLPYEPAFFDLITCTNSIHYFKDPVAVLRALVTLLIPQGQLVLEDYARRTFPFPWKIFECLVRRVDPQHVRAYTLAEAYAFCQLAGCQVHLAKNFAINWLWQGWVMQARTD